MLKSQLLQENEKSSKASTAPVISPFLGFLNKEKKKIAVMIYYLITDIL